MSRPRRARIALLLPVFLGAALLGVGCDSSTTVQIGAIQVNVIAIGNNIDPDGYTIRVSGNGEDQSQSVDPNGQLLFAVPPGRYVVELLDKAPNCIVDLNPQGAQVSTGNTSRVEFVTLCG